MLKKRMLSAGLALMLTLGMSSVAFAATGADGSTLVSSVKVRPEEVSIVVGASRTLKVTVTPSDADDYVSWESDDDDIVEVDYDGVITGISVGTAKVTAYGENNKKGSCVVTVTLSGRSSVVQDELEAAAAASDTTVGPIFGSGDSTTTSTTTGNIFGSGATSSVTVSTGAEVTADELNPLVDAAISKASAGTGASVVLGSKGSVAAAALQSAATSATNAGNAVTLKFTTPDASGNTQGQLNINAASAAKISQSIYTGINTDDSSVSAIRDKFTTQLDKKVAVIKCGQSGSYDMSVDIYAKVDLSGLNASSLTFYTYDVASNTHATLNNTNYSVDANGYLHLTTTMGGYIIIV